MRIFVAGGSGVIGIRLLPLLLADGHIVAAMTRSGDKADALRVAGAELVVCDVFDAPAVHDAVAGFAPDAVVNELTDLPDDPEQIAATAQRNIRMRREGTGNLLAATAALTGARRRFVVQSVAWELPGRPPSRPPTRSARCSTSGASSSATASSTVGGPTGRRRCPRRPGSTSTRPARRTAAALDAEAAVVIEVVEPDAA
jgi:nucleoside-diphosphate-sugar epimerase